MIMIAVLAAAGFNLADLASAAKAATDTFAGDHAEHVEHVADFAVSKSGTNAKVKVDVAHDGMTMVFNYTCHKGSDGVECQEDGE